MTRPDDTRTRLIQVAGDEFARSGFAGASVRAICEAADANVSAVKYHFGSKEKLYLAVWEQAATQLLHAEPMPRLEDHADPRDALRSFMAWFMRLVLMEHESHPWAGRLLAHETIQPTEGALDVFIQNCAGPIRAHMTEIVRAIVGRRVSRKALDELVFAVIALCVNPKHACQIMTKFGHPPPDTRAGINRLARTMAEFAIGGLEGFRKDQA